MEREYKLTLVAEYTCNNQPMECEISFTGYDGYPMLAYQVENYCKRNHVKIISKRPKYGRVSIDKYNQVWHVTHLFQAVSIG